jgi:hypothetical protein
MAHRVIANLVSLALHSSPIINSCEFGDGEKKRGSQMSLVQLRDRFVELHAVGIIEGERHSCSVIIPGQHLHHWCLRLAVGSYKAAQQS